MTYSYRFTTLTQAPSTVLLWIFPWEPVDKRGGRILWEWVCFKLIRLIFISTIFISQAATDVSDVTGTISCAGKSQRLTNSQQDLWFNHSFIFKLDGKKHFVSCK